eukprot:TRINITY_DN28181_c0_g1_i1.p1 TRINITY_DN28181_c0_g1~~TRINITY_DN28181_c0_g1_i1.p1  ORF type:complete len:344 (+),score=94.15 TRINITY_DN28181_c0_g1_i1:115-1146(+)
MEEDLLDFVFVDSFESQSGMIPSGESKFELISKYSLNSWYPYFKNHTFSTQSIPINAPQMNSLLLKFNLKTGKITKLHEGVTRTLQLLENTVTLVIEQIMKEKKCDGVFVRLASISPKDAAFYEDRSVEGLVKILKSKVSAGETMDLNQKMVCLQEAVHQTLKVKNGGEALDLLSSSIRVRNDLLKFIHYGNNETYIVIREWKDFNIMDEFRGFVSPNGNITAIGQYYHFLKFPYTKEKIESIKEKIISFFQFIRKDVQDFSPCVIDFIIQDQNVILLEINPFGIGTGAGLFNWNSDEKLLNEGPLEMRIRLEERDNYNGITLLPSDWKQLLLRAEEKTLENQ